MRPESSIGDERTDQKYWPKRQGNQRKWVQQRRPQQRRNEPKHSIERIISKVPKGKWVIYQIFRVWSV